ncbi:iron-containing redox enzyme family protein [Nitrospira defluvii]|nr:iron-containing redox enzyme family protein [Nitrospira defluvii]
MEAQAYLRTLEEEILQHEAVHHPFLKRFASDKLSLEQIQTFGLQHYQLVRIFVNYMTNLLPRIPDKDAADLFREVFDDEFGQHTIFRSHPALYRNFLKGLGLPEESWGRVKFLPETTQYIEIHTELTRESNFIYGLGIVGPAHEFAIPTMFKYLISGLKNNLNLSDEVIEYFACHIVQDEHHAVVFNKLIFRHIETEVNQKLLRDGAMQCLAYRKTFWDGLQKAVFGEVA